ncbi:MAG: MBOAT family protein [Ruminococcaceae bacterium]|nr:MBOAT family protein [Oscillospiraceae bacterium]
MIAYYLGKLLSYVEYTSYFSLGYFLVILPFTLLAYLVSPKPVRRVVLLLASYAFFFAISGGLLVYLLATTASVCGIGLWLSAIQKRCDNACALAEKSEKKGIKAAYLVKQRWVLALGLVFNIGILVVLKYSAFFIGNINTMFGSGIRLPHFLLPIGISFYTMQAASYLFDVYRKRISADRNILRVALYMSFFPQIMEGPICRYEETAEQLYSAPRLRWDNLLLGGQRILFGVLKKMVIADRLNMFINNVFTNYGNYDGFVIALAAICYTIQLYMDFSGAMDVVCGSGQIFGINMPENFKRPFFSKSISEFWTRWHITLGTWFKDYLFYPLSMSKPLKKLTSKARKKLGNHFGPLCAGAIALFCVWLMNGLWHGAGWNYIFFGMYHFVLILCGNIFEPYVIKLTERLHIKRDATAYKGFRIFKTTLLVCIGELFFRADTLTAGLTMFKKIFTGFTLEKLSSGALFTFGLDKQDYFIVLLTTLVIFIISLLKERGINIRASIAERNIVLRFAVWYLLIMAIVIFGAYGVGYIPVDPIYAAF